jgi:glycosyltransferase involved in cell wall biosynthesis
VIATILRRHGTTGVHTHLRELQTILDEARTPWETVTPFSRALMLSAPTFAVRLPLEPFSGSASVAWYRYFHEQFLRIALRKRLSSLDDAIIYAQGPVEAHAALLARRGPQQRVIMAVHFQTSQADEWARKRKLKVGGAVYRSIRKFERSVVPQVDGIVFVSHAARRELISWLPEAAEVPWVVIPNFLRPVPSHTRGQIGDLVTVGVLEIAKNHEFLLQVLSEARGMGTTLTLDIYGEGRCRKALERLAATLDLTEQVRFRGFRPDVRDFLGAYRAYVHASYAEALPFAILEAMAAGLPIVAGSAGGVPEIFDDGVEGRLWPLDDPYGAATMLLELIGDETRRSAFGAAALERYRSHFHSAVAGPQLYAFLTQPVVLRSSPPDPMRASSDPFGTTSSAPRSEGFVPNTRRLPTSRVALDGMALRRQGRGVGRVLQHLLPLLAADRRLSCVILSTNEGREILGSDSAEFHVVPSMAQTAWEQSGLSLTARKVSAEAIYSFAECGPLWGPPLLLHVPEDPFTRWRGEHANTVREHLRRGYQRAMTQRSLRRASVLAADSSACRSALQRRFGLDRKDIAVVPLGVDRELFHPTPGDLREDGIFHLSSVETRDMSTLVIHAYAKALLLAPDLPDLLIGGDLGVQRQRICHVARQCGVDRRLHLLGRISDEELRRRYADAALCVQPSRYEGFGLQPLEALACGAPLVISPEPTMVEVVGDAAIVAEGNDVASLAECIAELWHDRNRRVTLHENGPRRAALFPWERSATLLAELLVNMVECGSGNRILASQQ